MLQFQAKHVLQCFAELKSQATLGRLLHLTSAAPAAIPDSDAGMCSSVVHVWSLQEDHERAVFAQRIHKQPGYLFPGNDLSEVKTERSGVDINFSG